MKIVKIEVENFRLLKEFSLDMEEALSLVIGKNNTGKTSILSILDKFLNGKRFSYDDFNMDYRKDLREFVEEYKDEETYNETGIKLRLFIKYTKNCNLENISQVMMDLDPENDKILLGFEYVLLFDKFLELKRDWEEFRDKDQKKYIVGTENKGQESTEQAVDKRADSQLFSDFMSQRHSDYFRIIQKSIEVNKDLEINENNFIDLRRENIHINEIVKFKHISARREVANREADKTLSSQTSKLYEQTEKTAEKDEFIENFNDTLRETDRNFNGVYKNLFKEIVEKVRQFGGTRPQETEIEIISSLQRQELLKGNTTVVYKHNDESQLPESYNGLGYMNLISMIFDIEILIRELRGNKDDRPADINLLFIEEPEAHTHPQMQYIFIKNIKQLLSEETKTNEGKDLNLQYIISTHSSHIVADSEFEDIKYLKRITGNSVIAKNLKDLKKEYAKDTTQYDFLTQYLTLNRAEIFFADKAILIEGDTERILIPAMLKKIDEDQAHSNAMDSIGFNYAPLLSQNISIIEVGAYSNVFDNFIDFLGIRTLIITDIDTISNNREKCPVDKGVDTSNMALKNYFGANTTLNNLKNYTIGDKTLRKIGNNWKNDPNGELCVTYQTEENGYYARSFEDAFIHLNKKFIVDNQKSFKGLKMKFDSNKSAFDLASQCIEKKTYFAMDILFHTKDFSSDWQIPKYIKEGLLWLQKN